jgi:protein TonB
MSAVTTGSIVTLALLFAMQGLIRLQPGAESESRPRFPADWIRVPPVPDPPRTRDQTIDKRSLTDAPLPPGGRPEASGGTGVVLPDPHPPTGPLSTRPDGLAAPDGPLISIVRVQPAYPPAALQRGLEGWVDVRFDVMPNGLATNIIAIASSNRIFERAAINAASRFRFKAPVVNGEPLAARGVEYRFRFDISE